MTRRAIPLYSLWAIVVEGATDRFMGRPEERNPYTSGNHHEAWLYGWQEADWMLEERGRQEAARWLIEAA